MAETDSRPEGFQRVSAALAASEHPHPPLWLDVAARTAQEAADALGVTLGQIAKSVVFRRKADDSAVLVITSGDKRVDEAKLKPHTGPLGRADADFVKARTGFSIGGVSPAGFAPSDGAAPPELPFTFKATIKVGKQFVVLEDKATGELVRCAVGDTVNELTIVKINSTSVVLEDEQGEVHELIDPVREKYD